MNYNDIRGYNGTDTIVRIPTYATAVRPDALTLSCTPAVSNNIFTLATSAAGATVSSDLYRINRRFTVVTNVVLTETDSGSATHSRTVTMFARPDNRNQVVSRFTFTDVNSVSIIGNLTGHVDYDSGVFTYQVIYTATGSTSTFATNSCALSVRFMPTNTMNGRIKVRLQTEMTDITIDQNEDFLIELPAEDIQDYRAIFKIDILRTLSEAIKRQIMLNKDADLAFQLRAAEADMATNGCAETLDLGTFDMTGGKFEPNKPLDVFQSIVPKIAIIAGNIRRNFNMYPSYIVAGLKTAALLRSLQAFALSMPGIGGGDGGLGWAGDAAQFLKMKVLEGNVLDEGKLYLSTKAPTDALEKTTIVDLIYQPLYIVSEVTDGNTRNFVRSRTLIDIPRTDGLGVLTISGMSTYFSN